MIPSIRKQFNEAFTQEQYEKYLYKLHNTYPEGALAFRVAETPIFVSKEFTNKILDRRLFESSCQISSIERLIS